MTQPEQLLPPMKWNAWGDPAAAKPLSDGIRSLLKQAVGLEESAAGELQPDQVTLRPSSLSQADQRCAGRASSVPSSCAPPIGTGCCAPAASPPPTCCAAKKASRTHPTRCLLPGTDEEVAAILRHCSEHGIAVVAFGGGTSVTGGLDPTRGQFGAVVSLDLRRFDQLLSLDEVSGVAELGAGVTGPDAERLLGERGFSLGHFPQSFEFATIGGFAATRSSGQDSAGYGRFNDMILGLRMITPVGTLDLGRVAASAAGPDLRQLAIGSEGVFGVITKVRLRVHPAPETTRYEAWSFPDFATGAAALRAVTQIGTGPTVVRLSDEAETGSTSPPPRRSGKTRSPAAAWG